MGEKEKGFQNSIIDKKQLKKIMSSAFTNYGIVKASFLADQLKDLGFKYATKAGISLSIEDLRVPPIKETLLQIASKKVSKTEIEAVRGEITEVERFQKIIQTWNSTSETLKDRVVSYFKETDPLNSVYMMAFSGARGNLSQVRQLVGMRGLMADPNGQIIDLPITTNFREGLTITDYIISSYGARKGLVDTALRTADSGYLTRRLIDVAQDIITREKDCKSQFGISLTDVVESSDLIVSLEERIIGRILLRPIVDSTAQKLLFSVNQEIDLGIAKQIANLKLKKVFVRSPLTCNSRRSVCQQCYGWNLAYGRLVDLGEAVGIIAAQSIGEPGTQLTMRTFHTGGVFTNETTMQISAEFSGRVRFPSILKMRSTRTKYGESAFISENAATLKLIGYQNQIKEIEILPETLLFVQNTQYIKKDSIIAELPSLTRKTGEEKAIKYVLAKQSGEVIFENQFLTNSSVVTTKHKTNFLVWVLSGQVHNVPFRSKIKIRSFSFVRRFQSFAETYLICMNSGKVELSQKSFSKDKIDQVHIIQSFNNFKNFRFFLEKENNTVRKCNIYPFGGIQLSLNLPSLKSVLKNSYPLLGYLENKLYQIETGGLFYTTNYRKIHSTLFMNQLALKNGQTIFYVPESSYKIERDMNELKVKKGQYVAEGFEIFKNQVTKVAGLIDFTNSKPFLQEVIVKPGQAIILKSDQEWQNYHKNVYFPGEILFDDFLIEQLSYSEVKKIGKDLIQIWIRPIIRYEVVKEKDLLKTKDFYNTEIKFGPFQSYLRNGKVLKTNKFSFLAKQPVIFNPKPSLKNLLTKIEIQQSWKNWVYLSVDISESISIDHLIPNEIQKQNFFVGSLVENNQYIEPYSVITAFEILIPKESFIQSIKQQIVGRNKKVAFFTNHDYKSIYFEDPTIHLFQPKLIRKAEKIGENLISQDSGLVVTISGNKIVVQKGQPYLFSKRQFVEKNWGSLVQKEDNLGLLIYERARTGDIVQGLPRVEEILEARKPKFNSKSVICPGIVKNILYNSNEILIWTIPSTVYTISVADRLLVGKLEFVNIGQSLNDAPINPHHILENYFQYYFSLNIFNIYESAYRSLRKVQALLLRSVQSVYYAQGVMISDKHIEIIIKQMTGKVICTFPGDTTLLPGEILDLQQIDYINKTLLSLNKALFQPILLGITKASLKTDSFISAASFQHTTQVLTEAAVQGKTDWLRGLKENVIVGRLIPAGTGFNAYTDISYISVKVPSSSEKDLTPDRVEMKQPNNRYEKLKKRITIKPI